MYARRICAAALLVVVSARAEGESDITKRWAENLTESVRLLAAAKYPEARDQLVALTKEMVELVGPGAPVAEGFGIVVVHRALAEAGMGNESDALWYWHVAIAIQPSFADRDLKPFGMPGEFLMANLPSEPTQKLEGPPDPFITKPKVLKRKKPKYPEAARLFRVEGPLVVQTTVGLDGRLRDPRVLQTIPAPTLTYVALEALRLWEFEPATREGQPIEVFFTLTVNYDLR